MGEKHCYIIQNLESGTSATYEGSSCGNTYINNAITFLKQIDSLLDSRLEKVKRLQSYYSSSFQNLWEEVYTISEKLNISYSILNDSLSKAAAISNCSSTKFDLIDFCNYIGDKAEYDAKIIVIFSSFLGVFGFVMLYSFLVILNSFREKTGCTDVAIIEGIQQGSNTMLDTFYRQCSQYFYSHYKGIMTNTNQFEFERATDKDDLFAESFESLWTEIENKKIFVACGKVYRLDKNGVPAIMTSSLTSFLLSIAKNKCYEQYRESLNDYPEDFASMPVSDDTWKKINELTELEELIM